MLVMEDMELNEDLENNEADKVANEDKHEKFIRLAEQRVTAAIKKIQIVGNLSNKSVYEYSEEQVVQIIESLQAEIEQLKLKFRPDEGKKNAAFSFKK